jgi:hypothetical protein
MRSIWVLVGAGLVFAASAWSADAYRGEPIAAVWKEQRLRFFYMGRTSRYTCDGLRDKVRAMLLELGARRDVRIEAQGCEGSAARSRLGAPGPRLNIVFSAPSPAGAKGKPPHAGDSGAVAARFEAFTITSDAFRNMGIADCELVEEFAHQILPRLVTRRLQQDIACLRVQQSGGRFLVRGEILRAVPLR